MAILGALVMLAAAIAFLVVGALVLFGGAQATQHQLVPGFQTDRPGPAARALALVGVWLPVLLIGLLCLLAAIKLVQVAAGAL